MWIKQESIALVIGLKTLLPHNIIQRLKTTFSRRTMTLVYSLWNSPSFKGRKLQTDKAKEHKITLPT